MDYNLVPYFLICQKHLTLKIITFYSINIIITLALEEFPYNYFVFFQSQTICKGGKCAMLFSWHFKWRPSRVCTGTAIIFHVHKWFT